MNSTRPSVALIVCILAFVVAFPGKASARSADSAPLRAVADVPLPGGTTRFDYQSFDPQTGLLYISHMGDGRLVVFDVRRNRVVANLPGLPTVTGVLCVPETRRVYASAAGAHELVVLDARSLKTVARIGGIRFPDGIAYDPTSRRVFVSDESGAADVAVNAVTNRRVARIELGGEAGNTHYDPVSGKIYAAVQTRNEIAAIDPKAARVVARYPLPGSDRPHGFTLDAPRRLMFVSCEGNSRLLVVDMRSMKVTQTLTVGDDPDVLAFDPGLRRLYVASESGRVSVLDEDGDRLVARGDIQAPNAHSVSVDPRTHRVYVPLKDVGGRPVLRVLAPTDDARS